MNTLFPQFGAIYHLQGHKRNVRPLLDKFAQIIQGDDPNLPCPAELPVIGWKDNPAPGIVDAFILTHAEAEMAGEALGIPLISTARNALAAAEKTPYTQELIRDALNACKAKAFQIAHFAVGFMRCSNSSIVLVSNCDDAEGQQLAAQLSRKRQAVLYFSPLDKGRRHSR